MSPIAAPTAAPAASPTAKQNEDLRKAARQFEAIFARQIIGSMRAAKLGDDMLGTGGDTFREMADGKMADAMADKGALGIADMLVKQFGAKLAVQDVKK